MWLQLSLAFCLYFQHTTPAPIFGLLNGLFGQPAPPMMPPPTGAFMPPNPYALAAASQAGQNSKTPGQGQFPNLPYPYNLGFPPPLPRSGLAGAFDNLAAGCANFGNAAANCLSGIFNGIASMFSSVGFDNYNYYYNMMMAQMMANQGGAGKNGAGNSDGGTSDGGGDDGGGDE